MDPELNQVKEQIGLILQATQSKLEPEQQPAFAAAASEIQAKYEVAVTTLADKNATAAEQKFAKDVTDAINKNLPNFTKGVLSATSAFKSGDYINGSAAIMDMCASAAQMIGSLSAAAGPYGALFGAVFTIVGQLLTYFGPKQPSLKDQILDAIRGLEAEKMLEKTQADGDAVAEYTATIYRVRTALPRHLSQPLATRENLENFRIDLGTDLLSIGKAFDKVSALYGKWDTAEWLKDEKTQDLEKWPEVLGVFCRTYSDSLLANMALASMANEPLVKQRLSETYESNPIYKDFSHDFQEINDLLIKLETVVRGLPRLWNDGNDLMQQTLKKLKPVAQGRGLHVHLNVDKYLYGATGRTKVQSQTWKNLPLGYGGRAHKFSITVAKGDRGSLKPQHNIFLCENWVLSDNGDIEHGRIKASSLELSGQGRISPDKFSDVWALPTPPAHQADDFVYVAHNGGAEGYVKRYELNANNEMTDSNWSAVTNAGLSGVRALIHPPAALPDDPDKNGLPPGSPLLGGGVNQDSSIVYGAMGSSREIYVNQSDADSYVGSPWDDYTGIDVDPYYLWVFRPEGFACATHASVMSCIQGHRQSPRWMEHSPTGLLGDQPGLDETFWVNGQETKTPPRLNGVRSLSPCQDGTLFASIDTRTLDEQSIQNKLLFVPIDSPGLYTTTYRIDLEAGRINVDPWLTCGAVGLALQVQKMPISCWGLFDSLNADLQSKLKTH